MFQLDAVANRLTALRSYYRINREGAFVLRQLLRDGRHLRRRDIRAAFEDARERFGSIRYALWLLVYSTIRGEFRPGWIPSDLHRIVILPRINGAVGGLSSAKTLAARLFPSAAWPDTGYLIGGIFYDREMQPIPEHQLLDIIFADRDEIVVKGDSSRKGRNVTIMRRDADAVQRLRGGSHRRPLVFQHRILPHPVFDEIAPGAAVTIRINTIRAQDGTMSVRSGHVRFPGAGQQLVRSVEAYRCALDSDNGCFGSEFVTARWQRITHHPDSGLRFERTPIPAFQRAADLVRDLHAKVPQLSMIGWDLMIDEQAQPRLLEWNGVAPGISTSEPFLGPHFVDLGWERLSPHYRKRD